MNILRSFTNGQTWVNVEKYWKYPILSLNICNSYTIIFM